MKPNKINKSKFDGISVAGKKYEHAILIAVGLFQVTCCGEQRDRAGLG
jgi:hypothetical protein